MSRTFKRLRRLFFVIIVFLAIIAISISILVRNIDEIIIAKVEEESGLDLSVEYFNFNPFRGFIMKGLSVTSPDSSLPLYISEVRFAYSMPALIKKRISITGITIVNPVFHLVQQIDGSWNILKGMKSGIVRPVALPADTTFSFPLEINLDKIIVQDIAGTITTPQGALTLKSGDIALTNAYFKSSDDFFAKMRIESLAGEINSSKLPAGVSFSIDLNTEIDNNTAAYSLNASLSELSPDIDIPELDLYAKGKISIRNQSLEINPIELTFEKGRDFSLSGNGMVQALNEDPQFDFKFKLNSLNIEKDGWVYEIAQRFLSDPPLLSFGLTKPSTVNCNGLYSLSDNSLSLNCSFEHFSQVKDLVISEFGFEAAIIDLYCNAEFTFVGSSLSIDNSVIRISGDSIKAEESALIPMIANSIDASIEIDAENRGTANLGIYGFEGMAVMSEALFNIPSNLMTIQPSPDYLDSISFAILELNPSNFSDDLPDGIIDVQINAKNQNGLHFTSSVNVHDSLSLGTQDSSIALPIDTIIVDGILNFNAEFTLISLDAFNFDLSKWLKVSLSAGLSDDNVYLDIASAQIDVLSLKKFSFPAQFIPVDVNPVLELSGGITAPVSDLTKAMADFNLKMTIDSIGFEMIEANDLSVNLNAKAKYPYIDLSGEILVPSIFVSEYRSKPIRDFRVTIESGIDIAAQNFNLISKVLLPSESLVMELDGSGALLNNEPKFNLNFKGSFSDSTWIGIMEDVELTGGISFDLAADYDSSINISGTANFADFGMTNPLVEIINLSGRIPFRQTIGLEPLSLQKKEFPGNPFYFEKRPYLLGNASLVNNFSAEKIRLSDYDMTGISADVYWEEGNFQIPYFVVSLFEGNLSGSLWLRVDSLADGSVTYSISAQAAEINSDLVSNLKSKDSKTSKVSFNFNFLGKQLDPSDPEFSIEGALHITQISPKAAENLMLTLDPEQQDKGIQSMLYFLEKGWGIRGFSFEVAHDFVYSTIFTQQPPLKKTLPFLVSRILPLEKEIRLSRLPIKFFLKM